MRISQKLTSSFLLVSLLVGILGIVSYNGALVMSQAFNNLKNDPVADSRDIYEIEVKVGEMLEATADYLLRADPDEIREFTEAKEEITEFVRAYLARAQTEKEDDEIELGKQITEQVAKVTRISTEIIEIHSEITTLYKKMEKVKKEIEIYIEQNFSSEKNLSHQGHLINRISSDITRYLLSGENKDLLEYHKRKDVLNKIQIAPVFQQFITDFITHGDDIIHRQKHILQNKNELEIFEEEFETLLDITREKFTEEFEEDEKAVAQAVENTINTIITVSVAAVFLAILMGILISRSISIPLLNLKEATVDIAQGNMDVRIEVKHGDEIGELAEAFDNMKTALRIIMEEYEEKEKQIRK